MKFPQCDKDQSIADIILNHEGLSSHCLKIWNKKKDVCPFSPLLFKKIKIKYMYLKENLALFEEGLIAKKPPKLINGF